MPNTQLNTLDATGLWLTISELAEAKGVSKAAISQRVSRLEEQRLLTTRPGNRKAKLVNLAEYDRLVGQIADLGRELGASVKRDRGSIESVSAAYTREQTRRMAYQAEIARLDLEERRSKLVAIDTLRPQIEAAIRASAQVIERLTQEADNLAAVCERGEISALERALKAIAHRMRVELADAIVSSVPPSPVT